MLIPERLAASEDSWAQIWAHPSGKEWVRAARQSKDPRMRIVTNGSLVLEPRFATTIARGTIVVTMSDSSRDDKEHDRLAPDRLRADIQAGFDQLARGEGREYDKESLRGLVDNIKARARALRPAPRGAEH